MFIPIVIGRAIFVVVSFIIFVLMVCWVIYWDFLWNGIDIPKTNSSQSHMTRCTQITLLLFFAVLICPENRWGLSYSCNYTHFVGNTDERKHVSYKRLSDDKHINQGSYLTEKSSIKVILNFTLKP